MTLEQIKVKIGERVDDDTTVGYTERYEGLFVSAMCDMIKAIDKNGNPLFSPTEYPELVTPVEKEINYTDGFSRMLFSEIGNVIFIVDVYDDPVSINIEKRRNFQKRRFADLQNIRSNEYLAPAEGEGYWSIKSDSVFILVSGVNPPNVISFDIVSNPNSSNWGHLDLETTLNYGRSFIEASIKRAAEILRSEIGLE